MSNQKIKLVRRALKDRIGPYPDVEVYSVAVDNPSVPCIYIKPSNSRFLQFQTMAFGKVGISGMRLDFTFVTNRQDEDSAQDQIDDLLDGDGQFLQNLLAKDIEDDMSQLVAYIELDVADEYGMHVVGGTSYFGITVHADITLRLE
jgi:hypothetical protein